MSKEVAPPSSRHPVPAPSRERNRIEKWPVPWSVLLFVPASAILLSLMLAFGILLRYSLNAWDPVQTMVPDWTAKNYLAFFRDPVLGRAFVNTMRISVIVTLVCLIVGYPVAYGISRSRHRDLLVFLVITPMLMDVLIRAYGWMVMLGQQGFVNVLMRSVGIWPEPRRLMYTELSVILELIHELIPFMILPIANVLERIDPTLRDAAMNLHAGPARTFMLITLPLSGPGVVAGTLLTFGLAMSAFTAPLVLGGGRVMTMTILIRQQMITTLNWPLGAAEAVVLVLVVLSVLVVYSRLVRRVSGGAV
jgi:putative spermidine/putrescine transport system permease protein